MKDDLTKERDEQMQEVKRIREELSVANAKQLELEENHIITLDKIQQVRIISYVYMTDTTILNDLRANVFYRELITLEQTSFSDICSFV